MARVVVWGIILFIVHGRSESQQNISIPNSPLKEPRLDFMAFLTTPDGGVVCSGTVIHQSYMLTAAGCFLTDNGEMISYQHKVLIGNEYRSIQQLLPHPAYRIQTNYYDVGLVKVSSEIRLGAGVSAIEVAEIDHLEVGDVMKTACWVMNDTRSRLQEEESHVMKRSLCGHAPVLGLFLTASVVCARVDHDECNVSKGSPLYAGGRQYGVASRHSGGRTMYTKVTGVRAWIVYVLYGEKGTF